MNIERTCASWPSPARTLVAPSSSRSRETVAWVASKPWTRSRSSRRAWLDTWRLRNSASSTRCREAFTDTRPPPRARRRAGAAPARLDLVDHQQHAGAGGELADRLQVAVGRHADARLALDRLDQHGGRVRADRRGQRGRVAEGHVAEAGRQRLERLLDGRLAGGGQRPQGAAVEAALAGHDADRLLAPVRPAPAPGQLDGGLDGLGAGVGEEHLGAAAEAVDQPLG